MASDALGGESDGRERVFDLVGDALRDFFPRELALGAEEFGDIFEDENEAALVVAEVENGDGGSEAQNARGCGHLEFGGRDAHALRTALEHGELGGDFGREYRRERSAGEISRRM